MPMAIYIDNIDNFPNTILINQLQQAMLFMHSFCKRISKRTSHN